MPTVWAALRICCAKLPFFIPFRHRCATPFLPPGEISAVKSSPFGELAVNEVNRLRGFVKEDV